jgi:hypothetical protein
LVDYLLRQVLRNFGFRSSELLMTILEPDTQLCMSGDIYAEYEEVELYRHREVRGSGLIPYAKRIAQ